MSNDAEIWYRGAYGLNVTKPDLPPLRRHFFSKLYDRAETKPTPIGDEGSQNAIDNPQKGKKTLIKISLTNVSRDFFEEKIISEDYKKFLSKSNQVGIHYKKIFDGDRLNKIPVLLFEDFNTTGVLGDPYVQKAKINGKRNDFFAFWWSVFAKTKEKGKGGSVGVGRLTFAFSSDIQTFFAFSVPDKNSVGKKFFCGLSVFGEAEDENGITLDPFCRFGVNSSSQGLTPITDENDLLKYHSQLKLQRGFDEPGLSMIVPFPSKDLCEWDNLYRNLISRYRYAIINDNIEFDVNGKIISKNTILDFVKQHMSDEFEKYEIYFDFLNKCKDFDSNKILEIEIDDNVRKLKKYHLPKEILDLKSKDYANEQLVGIKAKFTIQKQNNTDFKAEALCFLKKTGINQGCDDLIRQTMPVSGERVFEDRDVNGLTLINDAETAEFCRLSESENHKRFDPATLDEKNVYDKFTFKLQLITNLSSSLHNLLIESEAESTSTDATRDWFTFGEDSEDDETKEQSSKDGKGVDTKIKVPENLFEDPKIYRIQKIKDGNKTGFKVTGEDVLKITEETIKKIKNQLNKEIDKSSTSDEERNDKGENLSEEDIKRLNKQLKKLEKRFKLNCFKSNL